VTTGRRLLISLALVAIVAWAGAPSFRTSGAAETQVSAAAEGVFPSGTSFSGVSLQGSTFAIGIVIGSSGYAVGEFQTVLVGSSLLGQPQYITLDGAVTAGSANVGGSVMFSGTGRLDLGDGSLATTVPFGATATTGGLTLTIGTTALPTQTLGSGSIFIQ